MIHSVNELIFKTSVLCQTLWCRYLRPKRGNPGSYEFRVFQRHFDTCQSNNIYASLGKSSCDICYYIYTYIYCAVRTFERGILFCQAIQKHVP